MNSFLNYSPLHGRWWSRLIVDHSSVSGVEVERGIDRRLTFFSDEDTRTRVELDYGIKLGPKWNTEFRVEWDERVSGLREVEWIIQRDLHDAVASVRLRLDQDIIRADDRDDNVTEFDVSFGIELKLPDQGEAFGPGDIRTMRERLRQPVIAY